MASEFAVIEAQCAAQSTMETKRVATPDIQGQPRIHPL